MSGAEGMVEGIDHLVLPVADLKATLAFYTRAFGAEVVQAKGCGSTG